MSLLSQVSCTPVRAGELPISDGEVAELHPFVPTWRLIDEGGKRKLRNRFLFDDESSAQSFLHLVEELGRRENHSATLDREGREVTVTWWTPVLGDLHPNDFIMAGKTDGAFTFSLVGAQGDMVTEEPLPTLAALPRFRRIFAKRAAGNGPGKAA